MDAKQRRGHTRSVFYMIYRDKVKNCKDKWERFSE